MALTNFSKWFALLLTAGLAQSAFAAEWTAQPNSRLAQMRGGFSVSPGLMVSFGIVRTVLIDGELAQRVAFQSGDLRSISVGQAQQMAQAGVTGLVQTGAGNTAATVLPSGLPGLVLQNTQNGRRIQTVTEIDAVSNGMGLLKGINLGRTLNDALGAAR